jgi:hypothetical protein
MAVGLASDRNSWSCESVVFLADGFAGLNGFERRGNVAQGLTAGWE